jgi:hypothetical protein
MAEQARFSSATSLSSFSLPLPLSAAFLVGYCGFTMSPVSQGGVDSSRESKSMQPAARRVRKPVEGYDSFPCYALKLRATSS